MDNMFNQGMAQPNMMNQGIAPQMPQGAPQMPQQGQPPMPQQGQPMPQQGLMQHPDPKKLALARKHMQVVIGDLDKVLSMPRGELNKKVVFDAASDMLAKGAFPDPQSREELVMRMSQLPDDEMQLRTALAKVLMEISSNAGQLDKFL